jgi:hypothetical protein
VLVLPVRDQLRRMGARSTFEEPPLEPADAGAAVLCWRQQQFRQLGLGEREAAELAASEADLGQARFLLASGCPTELALRILR